MTDAIREKVMILFTKRRKISTSLPHGILPTMIHQLNAASRGLGHLKISKGHPNEAEVTEVYKDEEVRRHVVYLSQKICTCRQWQVTGKPCPHALTVITSMRQPDMGSFVDNYYSVAKFQAAYAGIIPSITDRNQWPEVDKGFTLHPPIQKKKEPGRMRKNRIKPASERSGKATRQVRCPNCLEYGHRATSWKCHLTGTKKRCITTLFFLVSSHNFLLCNHDPLHFFTGRNLRRRILPSLGGKRSPSQLLLMLLNSQLQGLEEHWQGKLLQKQREMQKKQN